MHPNLVRALPVWVAMVLLVGCASPAGSVAGSVPGPSVAGHRSDPVAATVVTAGERRRPVVRALRILRGWDERRAVAYASGEPAALRRLYAPGSRAGARDLRVLRAYAARGLVVEALTVQVLRARLLARSPTLLRLRLVDRVAAATAVRRGAVRSLEVSLPAGRPVTRIVTMVRPGATWVLRAVRRP